MPDINPNPHEYGYVFIPINRITALFASENDLREAVKELFSAGFAPENLDIFVGEQGADALDLTGEGHGTVTRRVRNFEALMVQVAGDSHQRADEALRAGGAAVAVLLDGKETMKNQVGSLLKRHRATVIRYWGRWTIDHWTRRPLYGISPSGPQGRPQAFNADLGRSVGRASRTSPPRWRRARSCLNARDANRVPQDPE